MSDVLKLTVRLTRDDLEKLDRLKEVGRFASRNSALHALIQVCSDSLSDAVSGTYEGVAAKVTSTVGQPATTLPPDVGQSDTILPPTVGQPATTLPPDVGQSDTILPPTVGQSDIPDWTSLISGA